MISGNDIIQKALDLGFDDAAITTAEPFHSQIDYLMNKPERYEWCISWGVNLIKGTNPRDVFPQAQSMLVVLDSYYREGFPPAMNGKFGRAYCNDDRVTRDGSSLKIKSLRAFLRDNGIDSKVPFDVPHRLAAARAGLGTFGRNNFLYARSAARRSSLVNPIVILLDREFEPAAPTINVDCPSYCRNACIAACPTGAISRGNHMDPRRCISFLTYYGDTITPREFREPMGMWLYGCDICQDVCPRNRPYLAQEIPVSPRMAARADSFQLEQLIHMTEEYYKKNIWPLFFYVEPSKLWRWKMNTARVMGNSLDPRYVPHLIRAFAENIDGRVTGMCAWALGRIGTGEAIDFLNNLKDSLGGHLREEIVFALGINQQ